MGFYEREIGFYREFAADCPVRKPRCYFGEVEMDSGASLLLLEDRHHPGKGHLSRPQCEGSRLKAEKLPIKPRPEGQVGVGHSRDASNASTPDPRPAFSRVTSCGRHQPAGQPSRATTTLTVFWLVPAARARADLRRRCRCQRRRRLVSSPASSAPDPRSTTPAAPRAGSLPTPTLQRSPADRASFVAWTH